jgi:hypothetical protein
MATTVNNTTTFAGRFAGEYIKAAFYANETLQHVTVKENIEFKQVVKRINDNVTFANATCAFSPTGTVNLTERILTLKKLQFQQEICLNEFNDSWEARDVQNGTLGTALTEGLISTMLAGIAQKNEDLVWTGSGANAGEYDGLLQLIGTDADGDINFVASPVTIDSTNVFAKIQALIAAAPIGLKKATERPIIYMSQDVWEAYMYANAAAGNGWYTYAGPEVQRSFMGLYNIAVCPGMPASTMVMAQPSNLWFGTNLVNEWNTIQVVDMTQWAEDNVRFSAKFFAGTQYGVGADIAVYSTWF